jgi:methylamine dehydrogenase heavy chain
MFDLLRSALGRLARAHPAQRRNAGAALITAGILACSLGGAAGAATPLPADPLGVVASLPASASPHWVWVNDFVFPHMSDGQAILVDGDSGRFLGVLYTGFGFSRVNLAKDGRIIYSPETYFSRGTRGTRTDVVTLYDPVHLSPLGEIAIPAKRSANMPMMSNSELTDDGRFLLLYDFTPAQSVTVVDLKSRAFAAEIETPGCALVYPTGARSFFSICSDGALLDVHLDDAGHAVSRTRTDRMFEVPADPATEKAVRAGNTWLFVSYGGEIDPVEITATGLKAGTRWSLLDATDKAGHWRPGGLQQLGLHTGLNRLYSIMHQGGPETHKDPGPEVWMYDLGTHHRIGRVKMEHPSGSIQLTHDAHPLLFSAFIESSTIDVYDAASGKFLRSIDNVGTTPTIMVTP